MEKKQYNATIDIFKYFCAILIVDSHVRLINIDKSFLFDLFRYALYFFHVSFGYYYTKSLNINGYDSVKRNLKRLIIPVLFWIVIYTLINIYNSVLSGQTTLLDFIKLQFISLFINGTGFHLWFMASLMIYVLIGYFIHKNKLENSVYILSIVLYVIGLLGTYYYFIGKNIPLLVNFFDAKYFTTYCRIFLHGFPLFMMGMYISNNDDKLKGINNNKLIVYSLVLFVLSLIEIYYMSKIIYVPSNISSLFMYLLTFPFFILLLKNPMCEYSKLGKMMKYISTFMYYSHPLFRTILASLFMRLFNIEVSMLMMSLIVVLLCSIIGFVLYKINNKYLNLICS